MKRGNLRVRDASSQVLLMVSFRLPAPEKRLLVLEAGRQGKSLSLLISEQIEPLLSDLRAHEAAEQRVAC